MSELKVYGFCSIGDFLYQGTDRGQSSNEMLPYYLKSEADKVIADLEESHKKEVEQLLMEIMKLKHSLELASNECCSISERGVKNARHHKYKRCLAMAELCRAKRDEIIARTPTLILNHPTEYFTRWENRWLEIAEKFKEVK